MIILTLNPYDHVTPTFWPLPFSCLSSEDLQLSCPGRSLNSSRQETTISYSVCKLSQHALPVLRVQQEAASLEL